MLNVRADHWTDFPEHEDSIRVLRDSDERFRHLTDEYREISRLFERCGSRDFAVDRFTETVLRRKLQNLRDEITLRLV